MDSKELIKRVITFDNAPRLDMSFWQRAVFRYGTCVCQRRAPRRLRVA